jgi:hypothetical protein
MGVFSLGRGTAKVGGILLTNGAQPLGVARVVFDAGLAANRTIGPHPLTVTLPSGAIVCGGVLQVLTPFTSAGANTGTIAFSVETANDIVSAAAVSGAPYSTTGLKAITPKANTPETTGIVTTAPRAVTATVALQALLTGKCVLNLLYMQGG